MRIIKRESRSTGRRRCRGEVLVYKLRGGEPLKGSLADVGSGGIRVNVDGSLDEGEVVRLVFPRRSGEPARSGRTILGHVAHGAVGPGCHDIGIAFGWQAAVRGPAPEVRRPGPLTRWLRFLACKAFGRHHVAPGR
jgi:hypothetical protein